MNGGKLVQSGLLHSGKRKKNLAHDGHSTMYSVLPINNQDTNLPLVTELFCLGTI